MVGLAQPVLVRLPSKTATYTADEEAHFFRTTTNHRSVRGSRSLCGLVVCSAWRKYRHHFARELRKRPGGTGNERERRKDGFRTLVCVGWRRKERTRVVRCEHPTFR